MFETRIAIITIQNRNTHDTKYTLVGAPLKSDLGPYHAHWISVQDAPEVFNQLQPTKRSMETHFK